MSEAWCLMLNLGNKLPFVILIFDLVLSVLFWSHALLEIWYLRDTRKW